MLQITIYIYDNSLFKLFKFFVLNLNAMIRNLLLHNKHNCRKQKILLKNSTEVYIIRSFEVP